MTGKNHVATNAVLSFALFDPLIAIVAILTAKLPDQLELFFPGIKHRGPTHVLLYWVVPMVFFYFGILFPHSPLFVWEGSTIVRDCLFGLFLGGFLHIFADFFSVTGVPFFPGGRYYAAKWYKIHTLSEYLVLAFFIFVGAGIFVFKNPDLRSLVLSKING